jgi:cobalamin biosynthesis protein CbiG
MGVDEMTRAVGIGAASAAVHDDVVALVREALAAAGPATILATLDRREALARGVAHTLGMDVRLFSADVLARVSGIRTPSAVAAATVGTPSVAEAAALAAAGSGARLVGARRSGRLCTCAVAESR